MCCLVALAACLGLFGSSPPRRCAAASIAAAHRGLSLVSFSPESKEAQAFRQGLRDAGYVRGTRCGDRVAIRQRRLRSRTTSWSLTWSSAKWRSSSTDVTFAARAALRATSTIPIVMAIVADPVGSGLVTNLAHPGGEHHRALADDCRAHRQAVAAAQRGDAPSRPGSQILWNPATPYHTKAIEDTQGGGALAVDRAQRSWPFATPEELRLRRSRLSNDAHAQASVRTIDAPVFAISRRDACRAGAEGPSCQSSPGTASSSR